MEDRILEIISKYNGKVTFKNIMNLVNLNSYELTELLLKLKIDGKILQKGKHYCLFPQDLKIGTITSSMTGNKYISYNEEQISLSSVFYDQVLLNDVVAFRVNDKNEAEVASIVDRSIGRVTCEVKEIDGKKQLIPYFSKMQFEFDKNILETLFDGDIILVDITKQNEETEPIATYVKKIGRRDDPKIDDLAIAYNFGFDNDYDEAYINEVNLLPTTVSEEEIKGRKDFRYQKSFTVDGIDTKDRDDGCFVEKLDNGLIRLYVHIADVSHYVKWGSKIFRRACEKTTSAYIDDSVFHMLYHKISNGICSLNPNVDRLTKTVIMDIDENGNIVNSDLVYSVINSRKKMTYEDVDKIYMEDVVPPGYEDFKMELNLLYQASLRLEKRYLSKHAALRLASDEFTIIKNPDGSLKEILSRDNSVSRKVIELAMVAANETVANWFLNLGVLTVYRVHETPNIKKINAVIETLNKAGFNLKPLTDVSDNKQLQNALETLRRCEEFPTISHMLARTLKKARYSIINLGHFALGLPAYLHFTSPIRRLADLLVHMMIDLILLEPEKLTPEYLSELEETFKVLCHRASKMERQADMASLLGQKRAILKALALNKDAIYEASVIGVGKKIKIRVFNVETDFDSHQLDNILGYDSKRKRYFHPETHQHLKIGTKLYVKISDIDPINTNYHVNVLGMVETRTAKMVKLKEKEKK